MEEIRVVEGSKITALYDNEVGKTKKGETKWIPPTPRDDLVSTKQEVKK